MTTNLTANFIFSGFSDYWGGHGGRGENSGCAFAFYGHETTVRDLVDQWVEESWTNDHDFEGLPESVSQDDIRACILESFTDKGRADYESGAIWEGSADLEDERECDDCGACIGEEHKVGCDCWADSEDWNNIVLAEDCENYDDYCESPVCIMLIEWETCPACRKELSGCDTHDDLCNECHCEHYSSWELGKEYELCDGGRGWVWYWFGIAGRTDLPVGPFKTEADAIEGHPEKEG